MLGNLYNFVKTEIVGTVPLEFEFIIPIVVVFIVVLVLYSAFCGFIILKDIVGGK